MGTTDYGPLRDSDELELLGELLSRSFGTTGEAQVSRDWASEHGPDGPRVLREDGVLAACLIRLPMGHFFGGRSVSTLGIAGVGVPAERRGEGHAKRLMTECLQEARREGFALSSLYASTFGLYRHLGYERAGNRFIVKVDPRHLVAQPADASMRPLGPDDEALVRSLYADYAKLGSGLLDRSDDIWRRVKNPARKPANGAVVLEEGQVTGYLRWVQVDSRTGEQPFDLVVSDHAASTPGAAR
ncbi:MAG: GNAT family N-acetyltransferase, partial [Planctomycetota bacterium]|nr:GNAT family N-acetyltransferase [Planctomycetota bacterium]